MSIEVRLEEMEKSVANLRRENRRWKHGAVSAAIFGCAFLLMGADGDKKEEENKPISTKRITIIDEDGKPGAQLVTAKGKLPGVPGEEHGFSILDGEGNLRARASWVGKRTTFGVYTRDGILIQAIPMN